MRQGQLGLSLKTRGAPRQSAVGLNLPAVTAWLDALPIANTGESARQLYQYLLDLNGHDFPAVERLAILKALQRPVGVVVEALRKHYVGQSVSLNEKQRKIAALAQAMQSEMAVGYKTVIEDMLGDAQTAIAADIWAPALHGAIRYLSAVLLRCYQLYAQPPSRIWFELHTLYWFAEQNNLLTAPVSFAEGDRETVQQAYLRIVLVAVANPYQLRQREVEQLYQALSELSDQVGLAAAEPGQPRFWIDLSSDIGPVNSSLIKQTPTAQWRSLQLEALLPLLQDLLREPLSAASARPAVKALGGTVMRHLLRAYGSLSTRAFSRTPASGTIRVTVGLAATHFLLTEHLGLTEDVSSAAGSALPTLSDLSGSLSDATLVEDHRDARHLLPRASGTAVENPFDRLYRLKDPRDSNKPAAEPSAATAFASNPDVRYDFNVAVLVNISPGGYCLALRGEVPQQTQTGEILGLMEQGSAGEVHWHVGTIRWMKRVPDASLHLGVQMIAPDARPVFTQVRNSQSSGTVFQRALLLPALKGIGQPATLITSVMPYGVHQKVRVKDDSSVYDVRLTKQVASSSSFRQFQFETTTPASEDAPTRRDDNEGFDAVWELL